MPGRIDVRIFDNRGGSVASALLALCLLLGIVVTYWPVFVSSLILGLLGMAWMHHVRAGDRRRKYEDDLRTRADQQDAWIYAGDPRGTFGHDWKEPTDDHEGPQR